MVVKSKRKMGYGFGTAPVFLTSICAILGAIMFLRFGFAVGNVGLIGALMIILLGHLITIPTGIAISEIATNLRVGGGGEYFIISRSFGLRIGSTIGVMLYAAQSISVAFYIIGFAEGFEVFRPWIQSHILDPLPLVINYDPRLFSIPAALLIFGIILTKGAKIGIRMLWVVFALIIAAVVAFMISPITDHPSGLSETVNNPVPFITVFAITFPAFTGMTAGVGLSGDLKDPGRSIPRGIIIATMLGFIVYTAMIVKLYLSAPVDVLASKNLILYDLTSVGGFHLGWVVIAGLVGATISSAVGFALVAPRTLQALGSDKVFLTKRVSNFIKFGRGKENEPVNGTLISAIIAIFFIFIGNLNMVAQIISMFFLITYGSVCLISFLEHFAGNPSYRPTFRTKWYISLVGAIFSFGIMFQMSPIYAILSLLIMAGIYYILGFRMKRSRTFAVIFQGVMFQLSRFMKIALQKSMSKPDKFNWRPSVLALTTNGLERKGPKDMLRWISHYYGFGTLVHLIHGKLDDRTMKISKEDEKVLIDEIRITNANYSVTTLVSPSMLTAVAQTVQLSGMSGMDNNTILFEFHDKRMEDMPDIITGLKLSGVAKYNKLVLRSTEHNFGPRKNIHVWLTKEDFQNVNLMILLSYIIMEHSDWKGSDIKIYTLFSRGERAEMISKVRSLIKRGRLPISMRSVRSKVYENDKDRVRIINETSSMADLTIIGFTDTMINEEGENVFMNYSRVRDILFVSSSQDLVIS
jgi:solute carrier family 12 sodium/potassium/chloride transporter 2